MEMELVGMGITILGVLVFSVFVSSKRQDDTIALLEKIEENTRSGSDD